MIKEELETQFFIKQTVDDALLDCYDNEQEVIEDILPGNYTPTPDQWLEIAAEIIRAVNRFRLLKSREKNE